MKRALIGGFVSLIGSIWAVFVVLIAGGNLVTSWDPQIGRLFSTVIEMKLMWLFIISVLFVVLGIGIMAAEFFRREK